MTKQQTPSKPKQKAEITDDALRALILLNVGNQAQCTSSNYNDVPLQMARRFTTSGAARTLEPRVDRMLRALAEEGLVRLGRRSGGIHEVTLARDTLDDAASDEKPQSATQASGADVDEAAAPEAESREAADDDPAVEAQAEAANPRWAPLMAAYRDLWLLWLIENGGHVSSEEGTLPTQFRERFALVDDTNTRKSISHVLQIMEAQGLIWRQRTRDVTDETLDPERWKQSRRTFGVRLLPTPRPTALDDLQAELGLLLGIVNRQEGTISVAGRNMGDLMDEPSEAGNGPQNEPGAGDQGLDEGPGAGDEFEAGGGSSEELASQSAQDSPVALAERTARMLRRAHQALVRAALEREVVTRSGLVTLNGPSILREAHFTDDKAAEAFWYLAQLGTRVVEPADGDLSWWEIATESPSLEAVRELIVDRGLIYLPRELGGQPPAQPAASSAGPQTGTQTGVPGPEELIVQLTRVAEELEAQMARQGAESAAQITELETELAKLRELLTTKDREIEDLTARLASTQGPVVDRALALLARHQSGPGVEPAA